jgi:hypothetical protein
VVEDVRDKCAHWWRVRILILISMFLVNRDEIDTSFLCSETRYN